MTGCRTPHAADGRLRGDTSACHRIIFHGRDDVLSLLVHLGYLGDDAVRSEVYIPNREILDAFRASTKGSEWTGIVNSSAFHRNT